MKRAFEPERSWPDAIESGGTEQFSDRELGVLSEQGGFEQARQKLARRVIERGDDAQAYLDAIRLERDAAPSGTAWEAWLARALSQGVQVASALFTLIPRAELAAFLAKKRVRWIHLEKQRDIAAAHELMRLRLERQLADEPESALTALEDPAFMRCAQSDPTLRRFAIGVMTGSVWFELSRVFALAPQYGVDWNGSLPDASDPEAPAVARLLLAFRLQAAWAAVTAEVACPPALERVVRIAQLTSTAQAERLARELTADLRVQRREYVRSTDCVTRSSPELAGYWLDSLRALREELAATHNASARVEPVAARAPATLANPHDVMLERCMTKLRNELRSDPLQRLWLGALVFDAVALALIGVSTALRWRALPAQTLIAAFLLGLLALLPLRRMTNVLLYRRNVRPVFVDAIATHGIDLAALVQRMQRAALPRRHALIMRAERDTALSLLSAIAELASAGARPTEQVRS